MDVAFISDVHGNLEALTVVLADIKSRYGQLPLMCLGDIVDYGPRPQECADVIRESCILTLMGNHESIVVGSSSDTLSSWSAQRVDRETLAWFAGLPTSFEDINERGFVAAHGCPAHGHDRKAEYMHTDTYMVPGTLWWDHLTKELFSYLKALDMPLAVFGHSHRPYLWLNGRVLTDASSLDASTRDGPILLSVPSVGQPRDGNPMTGYAVVRQQGGRRIINLHRLAYDVGKTSADLHQRGHPRAERMARILQTARYH